MSTNMSLHIKRFLQLFLIFFSFIYFDIFIQLKKVGENPKIYKSSHFAQFSELKFFKLDLFCFQLDLSMPVSVFGFLEWSLKKLS